MKNVIKKLIFLVVVLLTSQSVSGYDFEVDGIYYNVLSLSELTCSVAGYESGEQDVDLVIPESVTYNGRVFSVIKIGTYSFFYGIDLVGITIPSTVSELPDDLFNDCINLVRVKIEDGTSVLKVGNRTYNYYREDDPLFSDCRLKELYLGRNLSFTPIKDHTDGHYYTRSPFEYQGYLEEVTIGNCVSEIGKGCFRYCGLTSITIPESVTSIGEGAFFGCKKMTNVTFPNSLMSIGESAFAHTALTNVSLPNSLTCIPKWLFYECPLEQIIIGSNISLIYPFGISSLTAIYSLNSTPPTISGEVFDNKSFMTLNVYVPREALSAYQNAEVWKDFWNLQGFDPETGINPIKGKTDQQFRYYDLNGQEASQPHKGINIMKMSNGKTKKVLVK